MHRVDELRLASMADVINQDRDAGARDEEDAAARDSCETTIERGHERGAWAGTLNRSNSSAHFC